MEKKTDEGVANAKYTHGYGVQVQYYVPSKLSKNIECNKKEFIWGPLDCWDYEYQPAPILIISTDYYHIHPLD